MAEKKIKDTFLHPLCATVLCNTCSLLNFFSCLCSRVVFLLFHPSLVPLLCTGSSLHAINFYRKFLPPVSVVLLRGMGWSTETVPKRGINSLPSPELPSSVSSRHSPSKFLLVKKEPFVNSNMMIHEQFCYIHMARNAMGDIQYLWSIDWKAWASSVLAFSLSMKRQGHSLH